MVREYFGSADDNEIPEPWRWVSPQEIIEGGEGPDEAGVREPRAPLPAPPGLTVSRDE